MYVIILFQCNVVNVIPACSLYHNEFPKFVHNMIDIMHYLYRVAHKNTEQSIQSIFRTLL